MNSKDEKYLEWFVARQAIFNLSEVSRQSGVPLRTLKYFADGQRGLSDAWKEMLVEWVKHILSKSF